VAIVKLSRLLHVALLSCNKAHHHTASAPQIIQEKDSNMTTPVCDPTLGTESIIMERVRGFVQFIRAVLAMKMGVMMAALACRV